MPTAAPSPPPKAAGRERKGDFHHMLFSSRDLFTHGTSPWGPFDERAFSIWLKCYQKMTNDKCRSTHSRRERLPFSVGPCRMPHEGAKFAGFGRPASGIFSELRGRLLEFLTSIQDNMRV